MLGITKKKKKELPNCLMCLEKVDWLFISLDVNEGEIFCSEECCKKYRIAYAKEPIIEVEEEE